MKLIKRYRHLLIVFLFGMLLIFVMSNSGFNQINKEKKTTNNLEQKKTIIFWDTVWTDQSYINTTNELLNQYMVIEPNIKINYEIKPLKYYDYLIATAVASKSQPDICTLSRTEAVLLNQSGFVLPSDKIIEEFTTEGEIEDFLPGSLEHIKVSGHYTGIPWAANRMLLFVRKDIFESEQVVIPKSLSELASSLKQLAKKKKYYFTFPNTEGMGGDSLLFLMSVNGGGPIGSNNKIELQTPLNKQVYDFLNDMSMSGIIPENQYNINENDAVMMFIRGEAPVIIANQSSIVKIVGDSGKDFIRNVKIIEGLENDEGKYHASPLSVNLLCILRDCKNKDNAEKFIKWLSQNNTTYWYRSVEGILPARKSALELIAIKYSGSQKGLFESMLLYDDNFVSQYADIYSTAYSVLERKAVLQEVLEESITNGKDVSSDLLHFQNNSNLLLDKLSKSEN